MTRLFLAGLGIGATLTLLLASLWGEQTCVGLSFSAGILFTLCVLLCVGWGLYLTGKRLGWITSTLTEPRNDRTVEL